VETELKASAVRTVRQKKEKITQGAQKVQTFSPAQPMCAEMLLYPNKAARILSISL